MDLHANGLDDPVLGRLARRTATDIGKGALKECVHAPAQGTFIHQPAPCDVDQKGTRLHQRILLVAEQVADFSGQRDVQRDDLLGG